MVRVKRIGEAVSGLVRGATSLSGRRGPALVLNNRKQFHLLRWFSLLSLGCIVLLSATLATVLSRFMTGAMVERDAAISSQFVESFAHVESVGSYFEGLQRTPPDPVLISFFNSFFETFLLGSDVIRTNVYARDGTVIWSSTAALVGARFGSNLELESALEGQIAVELGTVGTDDKAEHVEFEPELRGERYIECYIPIWHRDRKAVVGVVEIYRLTEGLFRAIDAGTRLIWISTLAGGALLYIALFGIVRKASIVIQQQERRLVESESLAAIGEMASAVAHGIRNPLASIRSSAEIATMHDMERARSATRDIISNVDRLNDWISRFLYKAHGDNNGSATADLNAIARNSLAGFAAAMQRQEIELTQDMEQALPLVRGDPMILEHVLNSIFANALEAMPHGGWLHLTTCIDRERRMVEVRIADNGRGLTKDMADEAFRPFLTSKHGGLGLGLALSRRVIERLGGTLDLSGTDGEGSVAVVRMPPEN